MSDDDYLMGMVKKFRTLDLEKRLELMPQILVNLDSDLRLYIYGLGDPSAARDVLQETMIAIFTHLSTFKGDTRGQFFSWLRRIARNKASDEFKKGSLTRMEQFPLDDSLEFVTQQVFSSPLTAEGNLDLEYALNLLAKSKPQCRELLWNHYVVGMDYDEIAEEINLKYDAIRMKITRCLDTARQLLEP